MTWNINPWPSRTVSLLIVAIKERLAKVLLPLMFFHSGNLGEMVVVKSFSPLT